MTKDKEAQDDEINIDFSGITKFFKKKDPKVEKIEAQEAKVEEKIEHKKEEIRELKLQEEKLEEKKEAIIQVQETKDATQNVKTIIEKNEADDEISFDFSKITNFFKGSKKESSTQTESKDSDEISFDFSKIKNMFKGADKKEKSDDDVSIDMGKAWHYVKKYHVILLLLIPLIFSMYVRAIPAELPITEVWAENTVYSNFQNQILGQVNQQYPHLPDANKQAIVQDEFNKFLEQNQGQLNQHVEQQSQFFKQQFQDASGSTYLIAIDPYYWLHKTENIVENGYPGDELRDGKPYNTRMLAPLGREVPHDMGDPYFKAFLYSIASTFNSNVTILGVGAYAPLIVMTLAAIPAFFIARRFGGDLAGLIAALIVVGHPAVMTRTVVGFADTDAYNIFFPLLASWLTLLAYDAKAKVKTWMFAALAGLTVGVYSKFWGGWWFILYFLLGLLIAYTAYVVLTQYKDLKNIAKSTVVKQSLTIAVIFVVTTGIVTTLISGFDIFAAAVGSPLAFASIKEVGISSVWPNVFTTVAEQNEVDLAGIISQAGGQTLFIIGLLGALLPLLSFKNKRDYVVLIGAVIAWMIFFNMASTNSINPLAFTVLILLPHVIQTLLLVKDGEKKFQVFLTILFVIWVGSTLFAATKGVRWILLMAPALGLGIGIGMGYVYTIAAAKISKALHIKPWITKITLVIIALFLIYPPLQGGMATAQHEIPSMNDGWFNALDKINREAAPDAVINSWWDFGHWFKAIGQRAVTFDGGSQNTPMAHWIGNTLLTANEKQAAGILRMLDCGSNNAFEELDKTIGEPYQSIDILYEIIEMDESEAKEHLQDQGLSSTQAEAVTKYTHCEPPENYFIASEDMIGKSGVWAHFGSWDFKRATQVNKLNGEFKSQPAAVQYLQDEFGMSEQQAQDRYFEIAGLTTSSARNNWIAPWPGYISGVSGCEPVNDSIWQCNIGMNNGQVIPLTVNMETGEGELPLAEGPEAPNALGVVTEDGEYKLTLDDESPVGFGVSVFPSQGGYRAIASSPEVTGSMFTRMFFYGGHGLEYFEPFTFEQTITGQQIHIYKVDWTGSQNTVSPEHANIVAAKTQIRASHILVNSSEQAEEIKQLLEDGENFAQLATAFSIDPSAQANGGDLGFFGRGTMVPEFEQVAFGLEVGQLSDPIQTQFGYHLILVTDKRQN